MSEIRLVWKGEEIVIPEDRAFAIGEQVEEIVTLAEIATWTTNPRMFKLARAFATMLRFAGKRVSDRQVHDAIMGRDSDKEDAASQAAAAMTGLVEVLMGGAPPASGEAKKPGKASAS